MKKLLFDPEKSAELRVVGIIRPDEEAVATSANGAIAFTKALTEYIVNESAKRDIVKAQLADPDTDVFTGVPFEKTKDLTPAEIRTEFLAALDEMSETELAQTEMMFKMMIESDDTGAFDQLKQAMGAGQDISIREFINYMPDEMLVRLNSTSSQKTTKNTYDTNMMLLGYARLEVPFMISIYPKDFKSKDRITRIIAEYNASVPEEKQIEYTDFIALLMSSVSTIINAITYILIAFVAISLVVSSIMIGIITYISVYERTKEIGILRAIGASKRNISSIFNAETFIIGLLAGLFGVGIASLIIPIINTVLNALTNLPNLRAVLYPTSGIVLIVLSIILTLIGGIIPSHAASKKNPVEALRIE